MSRWISLAAAAACLIGAARGWAQDEGAATFESARKVYAPRPWRPEDVVVPKVDVKPDVAAARAAEPADSGPKFKISSFSVVGDTLLGLAEIERVLKPFALEEATFGTVEKARTALQEHYADAGFLTAGVAIPPQNVEDGVVELRVVEARLGDVAIENEGRRWVGDDRVRMLVPHLRPGALLRQDDLQSDLARANTRGDLKVRPVLSASKDPGQVDLKLHVEDRLPLHGSFEIHNQRSAGSPQLRASSRLSYTNLWEREHAISLSYSTAPTYQSADLQIFSGAYSMPSPFREGDHLVLSVAHSDSASAVPDVPEISTLGKGLTISPRYEFSLPEWHNDTRGAFLYQGLSFALDVKNIDSTLVFTPGPQPPDPFQDPNAPPPPEPKGDSSSLPIRYRPFSLEYWLQYGTRHSETSGSFTFKFNRAGFLNGADERRFQITRGTPAPGGDNPVTGNYEVLDWDIEHTLRLSSVFNSLAAGEWLWDKRPAAVPLAQDWSLVLRSFGQLASEPLIPTEQMPGGGLHTVRGYLEAEFFGDVAAGFQLEVLSRPFQMMLGSRDLGSVRFLAFYDDMSFRNLKAAKGQPTRLRLYSTGLGLRARWQSGVTSDLMLGYPLRDSLNTEHYHARLDFRLGYGF